MKIEMSCEISGERRTAQFPAFPPISPALVNLPDDDCVEDDERDIGDELHDDHLAPEGVVFLVHRVQPQRRLTDRSLVRECEREHVRLQLEELRQWRTRMVIHE